MAQETANAYRPASAREIGVVIMPHGATLPYNDAVARVIAPLRSRYRIEIAYGMADADLLQQAISKLEQDGARRVILVRMYAMAHHLKDQVEYLLGLSEAMPAGHGGHDHAPPPQVRSAALFATFGGYEESPLIARILHDRIMEISRAPHMETVILVAHGDKTDDGNATWLSIMRANIDRLRKDPHCAQLKGIHAATVREDWPDKRESAVADVRRLIQEGGRDGHVLVIADRLYGSGPYKKFFQGLDYRLNESGLNHPLLTEWLADGLSRLAQTLTRSLGDESEPASPPHSTAVH